MTCEIHEIYPSTIAQRLVIKLVFQSAHKIESSNTYFKDETHQRRIKEHDAIMTTAERHVHAGTS